MTVVQREAIALLFRAMYFSGRREHICAKPYTERKMLGICNCNCVPN